MKTNKILGVLMAVLMVASAVALVSAKSIPADCSVVIVSNGVPEAVNVTSYYGDGTVKESFIIPAHDEWAPQDAVQILVPKNGTLVLNDGADFISNVPNEKGQYRHGCGTRYLYDESHSPLLNSDGTQRIGF
ncbi:MAG: hypothetical protein LBR15_02655 [Methanobrevibacter sp.]|nr:hypothetical protein [Candidatus Methanovirga australis]